MKVDSGQITQVLVNLVLNARDAMPNGGLLTMETMRIKLDAEYMRSHNFDLDPGDYAILAVSDTGSGMDQETRARAFDPFFTTKPLGKGTGLGLATVYGIVQQSGGHVWLYSEPGRGTTFKVYIPCTDEEESSDNRLQESAPTVQLPRRILVVDDEMAVRKVMVRALGKAGYEVTDACSAEEALSLVKSDASDLDLVITDVVLTGMGGEELGAILRDQMPGLPVLFISGYTNNAIVHNGVLDPGTLFLAKPFSISVLLKAVANALNKS